MAVGHVSVKNGARGSGGKHADYIAGTARYSNRDDVVYLEDGNLPTWAADAGCFFRAADQYERGDYTKMVRGKDGEQFERLVRGRAYKEVEVAIPREVADPNAWAREYARDLLGDKHPYRLAVHDKLASDGGRNCHIHLMFSTRVMDGYERDQKTFFKRAASAYRNRRTKELRDANPANGGARKDPVWNQRERIKEIRSDFERRVRREVPNFELARSDSPEPKIGPRVTKACHNHDEARTERFDRVLALRAAKRDLKSLKRELDDEQKREPFDWSKFRDFAGYEDRGERREEKGGGAKAMLPETVEERRKARLAELVNLRTQQCERDEFDQSKDTEHDNSMLNSSLCGVAGCDL